MIIRKGLSTDLTELQKLFSDTIKAVCQKDYNHEQLEVWASGIENRQRWQTVMAKQHVIVAQDNNGKIIGFCSLDNGNYIDLMFVHKDCQRQGIAYKLYAEIEKEAKRQRQTELSSNVSKTARPFFERIGFSVKKEQSVNVKSITLTNYKMTKTIEAPTFGSHPE
ncbi:GCN5-related N-acetyltransferase [Pseudopedobacter saltans DSM 12145]|uniref:GCN5-related N-acetyltransferase n=1 Tax=Pseudopedobacter saltans (strain ATCC 51119 / DSM 12145 / JCM 21818 / CCUG 39354 / LMG 10337 / NBRC 100064 / NCIMB 13643) TaxID=762903 RepID=F0SA62_PSESL|nr:GNAT family N-acetyltransferase [Pseudopedobacter saltans]ADY53626.1 GCN5-related N-acetyltransferase [Pseudopedobacter saltans DSM 12145]